MSNFWNMVGFEFKKILAKKGVIVIILLALAFIIFSNEGLITGNYYDTVQKDRAYARTLAGRPIDSTLLLETAESFQKIPTVEEYWYTDEYELYGRPYESIYSLIAPFITFADLQKLTPEQADDFYEMRYEKVTEMVDSMQLSQNSKDKLLLLNEQIETPFIFDYTDGYTSFVIMMKTIGGLISIVLAICLAPIFTTEYTMRTDQLILSSKNGKRKLIYAKFFVGFSLSAILSLLFTATLYFNCMLAYGSDGATAPLQLSSLMTPYPLTMGQFAFILFVSALFANMLIASIIMLLSARVKSSFEVILIMFLLIISSLIIQVSETNVFLHNLVNLIPAKMVHPVNLSSPILYEIFGLSIEPYIFMPIFAALLSIVLLPFAFWGFKNHQV